MAVVTLEPEGTNEQMMVQVPFNPVNSPFSYHTHTPTHTHTHFLYMCTSFSSFVNSDHGYNITVVKKAVRQPTERERERERVWTYRGTI